MCYFSSQWGCLKKSATHIKDWICPWLMSGFFGKHLQPGAVRRHDVLSGWRKWPRGAVLSAPWWNANLVLALQISTEGAKRFHSKASRNSLKSQTTWRVWSALLRLWCMVEEEEGVGRKPACLRRLENLRSPHHANGTRSWNTYSSFRPYSCY